MFLKGLLFGIGLITGTGVMVSVLLGILFVIDWAPGMRSRRSKEYAPDRSNESIPYELIAQLESAIVCFERMRDLLQSLNWRSIPTKSMRRQTFTIQ